MAKKPPKQWIYSPKSLPKPTVPEAIKRAIQEQCNILIDTKLKPRHIQPPPEEPHFSYIVDLYSQWYRNYFYFCAKYRCPAPTCISEFFEVRYTRLEYTAKDIYTLSYMRHTQKWQEVYSGLSLADCLSIIEGEELFGP
jgi:hypothetical protein